MVVACWSWNLPFRISFEAFWSWNLHFARYLQRFGAGTLHFACHLQHFGAVVGCWFLVVFSWFSVVVSCLFVVVVPVAAAVAAAAAAGGGGGGTARGVRLQLLMLSSVFRCVLCCVAVVAVVVANANKQAKKPEWLWKTKKTQSCRKHQGQKTNAFAIWNANLDCGAKPLIWRGICKTWR